MSEQIPIRPTEEINFGKAATFVDCELVYKYLVFGYASAEKIDGLTSTHPWVVILKAFNDVFARVRDENFSVKAPAKVNNEIIFLNIGRLARLSLKSDSYIHTLLNLESELARDTTGTVITDTDSLVGSYIDVTKWIAGAKLESFIGSWNSTHYRVADDIMAGAIISLFYVMFWWTGFVKQYKKLIKKIGSFTTDGGTLRGSFQPLIPSQPHTWGSALVAQENIIMDQEPCGTPITGNNHVLTWDTAGHSIFGLSTLAVDDAELRGITVSYFTHADSFWNSILNRSEWEWRHGKTISVEPVFCPYAEIMGGYLHDGDFLSCMALFSDNADGNDWRWFNSYINTTVSEFKDFFFKNASFGKLKALLATVPFSQIPDCPEVGTGGLLFYQMAHWADGGASSDTFKAKFLLDTSQEGQTVLMNRRDTSTNYKFLTLGDITVRDYRIMLGLFGINAANRSGGTAYTLGGGDAVVSLVMMTSFGFIVTRTEDLPPQLDRHVLEFTASGTKDHALEYVPDSSTPHPMKSILANTTWHASTGNHIVGSTHVKSTYYTGRSADPFKKLKHFVHDMNHLDADLIRNDMLSIFYPGSGVAAAIPVSAMPSPMGEVVATDMNAAPKMSGPIAVSAAPEKKEDKKEDKK